MKQRIALAPSTCRTLAQARGWLCVFIAMMAWALPAREMSIASLRCGDAPVATSVAAGDVLELTVPAATGIWIEERGAEIEYRLSSARAFESVALRPPRYGKALVVAASVPVGATLTVRAIQAARGAGVRFSAACDNGDGYNTAFLALQSLFSQVDRKTLEPARALETLAGEHSSDQSLLGPWWLHARAQLQLLSGAATSASGSFVSAQQAWLRENDPVRAGIALLAAAEDASRAGDYDTASMYAHRASVVLSENAEHYFALRAAAAECLVRGRSGATQQSLDCTASLVPRMIEMGEHSEAAVTAASRAQQWLLLGDSSAAEAALAIPGFDPSRCTATALGRYELAFADIEMARGRIDHGATHYANAAALLTEANVWKEAATLNLKISMLALRLDLPIEYAFFLRQALRHIRPAESPAAVAKVLRVAIRGDLQYGHAERAAKNAEKLRDLALARGDVRAEAESHLFKAEAALGMNRASDALQALAQPHYDDGFTLTRLRLSAEAHALLGDRKLALAALEDARLRSADPHLLLDLARIEYSLEHRRSRFGLAETRLAVAHRNAMLAVRSLPTPSLRLLMARRLSPTRMQLLQLILDDSSRANAADAALRFAADGNDYSYLAGTASNERIASVLDEATRRAVTTMSLDSMFAMTPSQFVDLVEPGSLNTLSPPSAPRPLHIGPGRILIAALPLPDQIAILLSRGDVPARVCARIPRKQYEAWSMAFAQALVSAGNDYREGHLAAGDLAGILTQCQPGIAAYEWVVYQDADIPALPWNWIAERSDGASVGIAVTMVHELPTFADPPALARIATLIRTDIGHDAINAKSGLPGVATEIAAIATEMQAIGVDARIVPPSGADRAEITRSLALPHSVVHIAGHGESPRFGQMYGGVWAVENGKPDLVAFPEFLGIAAHSELVVLSTCAAANANAPHGRRASHLAEALLAAGARRVIATQANQSDNAAVAWTQVFYRFYLAGDTPSSALMKARRSLQQSRHFRHPFHWAGLELHEGYSPANPQRPEGTSS